MREYYSATTAFLDLLFNALLGFVAMFFLAFILIAPKEQEKGKVAAQAEFIITFTWDNDKADDVDSYVQDPLGHMVHFRAREDGLMHLDRDDLGGINDTIIDASGNRIEYPYNREIVTIRGIVPGEYCVNAHMYRKRHTDPTTVTVLIEKINPLVTVVTRKTLILVKNGDEKTACRFIIDKEGKILDVNDLPKRLVVPDHFAPPDVEWEEEDPDVSI